MKYYNDMKTFRLIQGGLNECDLFILPHPICYDSCWSYLEQVHIRRGHIDELTDVLSSGSRGTR